MKRTLLNINVILANDTDEERLCKVLKDAGFEYMLEDIFEEEIPWANKKAL